MAGRIRASCERPAHESEISLALTAEELDALAARGVFVRDGFLGEATARAARAEVEALADRLRPGRMSRGGAWQDAAERGDAIAWLDEADGGPALAALWDRFAALGEALRRQAYLGLRRSELQVARYAGGARYGRHRDAFRDAAGATRRASAIFYLNPGWTPTDGGCLRLHLGDSCEDVAPVLDRLVVFLSERVEHEVLPAHAPRWAVTAWFYGP